MSRWTTAACLVLLGIAVTEPATKAAAQDVVYTRQPRFRIPYHSDPAELQRMAAREVHLYLSTDRGLTWRLAQAVPPTTGRFSFDAPADGEYWFSVRTLDGRNQLQPPGATFTPGLKVVVDSINPDLMLSLERSGQQVRLNWRASDVNLDATTLRLEFRQIGMDNWENVQVVSQPAGTTAWTAPSSGAVSVRGQVQDRSGNVGTGQAELNISNTAGGYAPLPARPELEGPIADEETLSTPFAIAQDQSAGVQGKLVTNSRETPVTPDIQARRVESPTTAVPQAEPVKGKLVNSRSFNLNYEVQDVGPSGVGTVEFFITDDGGKKWYRYGNDADLKSPFRIDVPSEGTYGFQVRVRSGVGLASDPPRPGDVAPINVTVDETPPQINIESAGQAQADKPGVVAIRWAVNDAHPSTTPNADLEYATSPQGPWTPIAQKVEQNGQYDWKVQSLPAAKLFIRVTARDAAGNVGTATTNEPVIVDLMKPVARITDIGVEAIEPISKGAPIGNAPGYVPNPR